MLRACDRRTLSGPLHRAPVKREGLSRRAHRRHCQRQIDGDAASSRRSACPSSMPMSSPAMWWSPGSRRSSAWSSASARTILTADGQSRPPGAAHHRVFRSQGARGSRSAHPSGHRRRALESRSAASGGPYQILVIPLLVEKNLGSQLDRVLVVDCEEELQIRRLQARDGSTLEEARAILNAQASRDGAPAGRGRCHQE